MSPKKARILVVDDAQTNIEILHGTLREDYTVIGAPNGEIALQMAHIDPQPDLILLDIMMPGMDGYEICKRLKNDDTTKAIPIIFITAVDNMEDEERGLKLGAVDYIKKPFSPPIVLARVNTHILLKQKIDQLDALAWIDGLTGIANRHKLDDTLEREFQRAARAQTWLSVIMIDLDLFKAYNDHYGHQGGDQCLIRLGTLLSEQATRASDLVARYGGEEFVILHSSDDPSGGEMLAHKLQQALRDCAMEHKASSVCDFVTMSIGTATVIPRAGGDAHDLLKAADDMLYQAKDSGRNQTRSTVL